MKRDADRPSPRSRSRKKAAAAADTAPADVTPTPEADADADTTDTEADRNVSPMEGSLSVITGVLFLVGALFPRTIKQLLMLGIGGGLLYRGVTGKCGVYSALGIDTAKEPLLKQINEKYLSAAGDA